MNTVRHWLECPSSRAEIKIHLTLTNQRNIIIPWSSAKVVPGANFLAPAILQIDTPEMVFLDTELSVAIDIPFIY